MFQLLSDLLEFFWMYKKFNPGLSYQIWLDGNGFICLIMFQYFKIVLQLKKEK